MASLKAPATKPFLQKLYTMLEDESAAAIMSWTPNGDAIVVHQPEAFAQQLLPLYQRPSIVRRRHDSDAADRLPFRQRSC